MFKYIFQQLLNTLLGMQEPALLGYTLETVIAEKLESIIKLALVNTRMKDFYDLWTIMRHHEMNTKTLKEVITEVFANRKTPLERPIAFTAAFYDTKETRQRWNNFLSAMGKEQIPFQDVIDELAKKTGIFFEK